MQCFRNNLKNYLVNFIICDQSSQSSEKVALQGILFFLILFILFLIPSPLFADSSEDLIELNLKGLSAFEKGNNEEAMNTLKEGLKNVDEQYKSNFERRIAVRYNKEGDFVSAKKWGNLAFARDDKNYRALNEIGVALVGQGYKNKAEKLFKKSLEINPNYKMAKNNLKRITKKSANQVAYKK